MLIFRTLGVLAAALGAATFAYDGAGFLASPEMFVWTSLQEHWSQLNAASFDKMQATIQNLGVPGLWPLLSWLMALPAWVSLGGMGVVLYWLGCRRKRPAVVPD